MNSTAQVPVCDFIEQVFIPQCRTRLSASTAYGYTRLFHEHKEFLPAVTVQDFRCVDGQEFLQRVFVEKQLSHNSMKNVKNWLSGVFKHAKRTGFRDSNPMADTSIPRGAEAQIETYAYSLDEILQLLRLVPGRAAVIIATAAFTGLRRGELAGLQWSDLQNGMLYVRRAVWMGTTDVPKTRKSKAPVPVIKPLQDRLDVWRGTLFTQLGHVPVGMWGETVPNLETVEDQEIVPFLNTIDPNPVTWHGWHAARRGLASVLHELGVEDLIIQRILRHASVEVTRQSYIKKSDSSAKDAMEKLSAQIALMG